MLKKIIKSKFLVIGILIGVFSGSIVRRILNPSTSKIPIWVFILPPIGVYFLYKLSKIKKI